MDHSEHFEITVIPYRPDSEVHSTLLPTMLCFLETQHNAIFSDLAARSCVEQRSK